MSQLDRGLRLGNGIGIGDLIGDWNWGLRLGIGDWDLGWALGIGIWDWD